MAANDTTITTVGTLTDDPELRFTPTGVAMAKFRIASTPRMYDKAAGAWKDGEALFMACTAWRDLAQRPRVRPGHASTHRAATVGRNGDPGHRPAVEDVAERGEEGVGQR
jgi:hypothetical protein